MPPSWCKEHDTAWLLGIGCQRFSVFERCPMLQGMVLCVLLAEAHFRFLPSVWIMFAVLLVQGLVEGTQFKSTMFKIYSEVGFS